MGHYTGFQIEVLLRKDIPPPALAALIDSTGMLGENLGKGLKFDKPDHMFFRLCKRQSALFWCSSAYLPQPEYNTGLQFYAENDFWMLKVGSSLKNYDNEIEYFLDWVAPYVAPSEYGKVVGKYQYEDADVGTPITFSAPKVNDAD